MGQTKRKAIAGLAAAHATASKAPSQILPRLYLSSYTIASNEEQLLEMGITHVVSVLEFPPEYEGDKIKTLHVKIEDSFRTNILQHLDVTTEFIKNALEESESNKVLVCTDFSPSIDRTANTEAVGTLLDGRVPFRNSRLRIPHRYQRHDCARGHCLCDETTVHRLT